MTSAQATPPPLRTPLRLWPGVLAATVIALGRLVLPIFVPDAMIYAVIGSVVGGLAIVAWWLLLSRAPWPERVSAIVLMVVGLALTSRVVHESVANGMMGMMLPIYGIPVLSVALVAWAVASRGLPTGLRRASMVASILLACAVFTVIRTAGLTGEGDADFHWRWTPDPEERLLAQGGDASSLPSTPAALPTARAPRAPRAGEPSMPSALGAAPRTPEIRRGTSGGAEPVAVAADPETPPVEAEWPGFRGPERDGIVRGIRIDTDWSKSPPVELWRRSIGPWWSSFAVRGDLVYTQEQRGDDEIVSCYRLTTGEPVWSHRDPVRFWESNGGAGPRGTPTVADDRVYALGATGILNALDAATGAVVWSRNAATDTSQQVPDWGIASSPLVIDDLVIVAVAGRLAAYDVDAGVPRWLGPPGGDGYSSPHLARIDGVAQILQLGGTRTVSVAPADGTLLWEYAWQPSSIVQPAVTVDGGILISAGDAMGGTGMHRIAVTHGPGGWAVEERWTTRGLKPYFNDFVVHEGHAFGFDGSILASIDLEDGARRWKGGRYGHGQLVLLPDQDVLLVLSEFGELALVGATTHEFIELARVPALDGKTWNHPVVVGDVLLVRNGEEMVAFRLSLVDR